MVLSFILFKFCNVGNLVKKCTESLCTSTRSSGLPKASDLWPPPSFPSLFVLLGKDPFGAVLAGGHHDFFPSHDPGPFLKRFWPHGPDSEWPFGPYQHIRWPRRTVQCGIHSLWCTPCRAPHSNATSATSSRATQTASRGSSHWPCRKFCWQNFVQRDWCLLRNPAAIAAFGNYNLDAHFCYRIMMELLSV